VCVGHEQRKGAGEKRLLLCSACMETKGEMQRAGAVGGQSMDVLCSEPLVFCGYACCTVNVVVACLSGFVAPAQVVDSRAVWL
jgi:hypothetical protein